MSRAPEPLPTLPRLLLGVAGGLLRPGWRALPADGLSGCFASGSPDPAHVAAYRQLFGNPGTHMPLGYFYLLAQRAQLALLLEAGWARALPGLVHTANGLRLHGVLQPERALELAVAVSSVVAAGTRPEVVCEVDIRQGGDLLISCHSSYRLPGRRRQGPPLPAEAESLPAAGLQQSWELAAAEAWRYARIAGDWNPIHLSALLARRFGFERAIAHGMYSVGRAAAAIEGQQARPLVAISARFRRPLPLPGLAVFGCSPAAAGRGCYGVLLPQCQRLALDGEWETAP